MKKPWKFQYLAFVLITNNLSYVAFHHGTSFTIQTLSSSTRSKLERLSYIGQSLGYFKNLEVVSEKVALTEIAKSMGVGYTGEKRQSIDDLVQQSSLSQTTYNYLSKEFQQPSISTLLKSYFK